MESAPLTLAHTHARNAAIETHRSNAVAASEEHDLAAAEFASAAQGVSDSEAVRILNLLEQHHKKLGQLLKDRHQTTYIEDDVHPSSAAPQTHSTETLNYTKTTITSPATERTIQPPRLSKGALPVTREVSSSIASNLASARGIPSHRQKKAIPITPVVSNQHADGRFTQDEAKQTSHGRSSSPTEQGDNSRPSWAPPEATKQEEPPGASRSTSDAPFQQFYSTFESLISKLSAPLAFAGLPLTSSSATKPEVSMPPPPTPSKTTKLAESTNSVDYSQLISRAALRAVQSNTSGNALYNPSESFYVVPTTGGTISYAEIMNRVEREEARNLRGHQRQTSILSNISEDEFVDAETNLITAGKQDPSNRNTRPGGGSGAGDHQTKVNGKTLEEVALENDYLKRTMDALAKRLHVFEMSSQNSTAALAQSIRSLNRSPFATPDNSRGKPPQQLSSRGGSNAKGDPSQDEGTTRRIAELEEILRKSDARVRKKEEENVKLREMITRYREKWDNLKAGAKARREREGRDGSTGIAATTAAGSGAQQQQAGKERGAQSTKAGSAAGGHGASDITLGTGPSTPNAVE